MQVNYHLTVTLCLFLTFNLVQAQFVGYQKATYEGRQDKVNKIGLINPSHNFYNDDLYSLTIQDGYYVDIYNEHDGKGISKRVTGKVAHLGHTFHSDRSAWGDRISSIRIGYLPSNYKDDLNNFKEGIYHLYNPYKNTYIRSGKGAGTRKEVETENEKFQYNNTNHPTYDDSYKFVVVRGTKGRFYIFNLASGNAIIPENPDNFEIGAKATSLNLSNGLKNEKLRMAAYKLKPHGFNRFSIVCNWNDRIALTMADLPWDAQPLTYKEYDKEAAQQFEFVLVRAFEGNKSFSPEIIKNGQPPSKENYVDIQYTDNKSAAHKVVQTKIPFYMVKDEGLQRLEDRINQSPFYTLIREEFVQRKGGSDIDGWFYNRTSSEAKQIYSFSTTNTNGNSSEESKDIGLSTSLRVMVSDGFFTEVESTTTFSTNLGFSSSEYSEYSKTETRTTELPIPSCSKGAVFGIGNRIALKRADGTVVKSFEVFSKESLNNMAITLYPKECPTLRAQGQQAYDDALAAYYDDPYHIARGVVKPTEDSNTSNSTNTENPTSKISMHGLTEEQYQLTIKDIISKGQKVISTDFFEVNNKTYVNASFTNTSKEWFTKHNLSSDDFQKIFNEFLPKGFVPTQVESYSSNGEIKYAVIMEKSNTNIYARHELSPEGLLNVLAECKQNNLEPVSLAAVSREQSRTYTLLAIPQKKQWEVREFVNIENLETVVQDMSSRGMHPDYISMFEQNGTIYCSIIFKSDTKKIIFKHDLDNDTYVNNFFQQHNEGYSLKFVAGYSKNSKHYYTAVWEK